MINENNGLNGLNGWFSNFWSGFRSSTGTTTGSGGWIGRRLRRMLDAISQGATEGLEFRTTEYVPTGLELVLLNKLKDGLNKYMISLVNGIDSYFLTNTSTELRLAFLNNAIRKVQIIRDFFLTKSHATLSDQAQEYLSDQIQLMVQGLELTIEELLSGNAIVYVKTEGDLVVNSSDSYPKDIVISSGYSAYGYQYKAENIKNSELETDVTTSAETPTVLVPNQATVQTDEVAGLQGSKKTSMLLPVLLVLVAVGLALMPSDKSEK